MTTSPPPLPRNQLPQNQLPNSQLPRSQFRAGDVVAAPDRCPHREAPLSAGFVEDGCLVCPYHGWKFGDDGRCVKVPSSSEGVPPPPRAQPARPDAPEPQAGHGTLVNSALRASRRSTSIANSRSCSAIRCSGRISVSLRTREPSSKGQLMPHPPSTPPAGPSPACG